jgi:RNA-splicing ligase RtcB
MVKIEKAWRIGERYFAAYAEAQRWAADNEEAIARQVIADAIEKAWISRALDGKTASETAELLASIFLRHFKIEPRR